ncbi:unnamed protein product (macronuclear) [Paramecium tetraurelia]|uniref:Uncharacterized protein n=1 Tax=Paramecium tetraurelia TaxID=5888 RepID=A0E8Y6_PARTE|nr:uncharacterized protein GSPATT00024484001 [Paramecium tetraurelia]CAK91753.1 unnamed protein product [Paramecium tetraurelia]|eukprot:XP_001459150.1 hypothetical protein (macronuclear) [Paramecium tetraurelia strain d4-2]
MSFTPPKSSSKTTYMHSLPFADKFQKTFSDAEMQCVQRKLDFGEMDFQQKKSISTFRITKMHKSTIGKLR